MANLDTGNRPRCKTMVRVDLYNAYAKLGVSPLMTTDEIKTVILRKRKDLMHDLRRAKEPALASEIEGKVTELQALENEIGTPKTRAKYDQANPQNELLTIQPCPHDRWLDPRHRASLISAWLVEELGRDVQLPSPESLKLWAPRGLDPELAAFLASLSDVPAPASAVEAEQKQESSLPTIADIERLVSSPDNPVADGVPTPG